MNKKLHTLCAISGCLKVKIGVLFFYDGSAERLNNVIPRAESVETMRDSHHQPESA